MSRKRCSSRSYKAGPPRQSLVRGYNAPDLKPHFVSFLSFLREGWGGPKRNRYEQSDQRFDLFFPCSRGGNADLNPAWNKSSACITGRSKRMTLILNISLKSLSLLRNYACFRKAASWV